MNEWTLADEMALQPVTLSRVAILCAQAIAYPNLDIAHTMSTLSDLAKAARPFVPDADPIHVRGVLLAEFLFTFALVYVVLNVATAKGTAGRLTTPLKSHSQRRPPSPACVEAWAE